MARENRPPDASAVFNAGDAVAGMPPGPGHAVLEASAGTGKTHAIVSEILRILAAGEARLPQILVVTFTEKAAAELRSRVQAGLKAAADQAEISAAERNAYGAALQALPQAAISTLHGFCHRVLREYGFENGMPLQLTIVDDGEVFETVLRDIQRRQWPAWYPDCLPLMLALGGYPSRMAGQSEWEKRLRRLAGEYRAQAGMQLLPADAATFTPEELVIGARAFHTAVQAAVAPWGEGADRVERWFGEFHLSARKQRAAVVKHLSALLTAAAVAADWAQALATEPYRAWVDIAASVKYLNDVVDVAADNAARRALVAALAAHEAWQAVLASGEHALMARTVTAVQAAARAYKSDRGLVSFDDMIERVDEQLAQSAAQGGAGLIAALRTRYKVALIDEFQDTDLLQWRILKRVFVEAPAGSGHRLAVIGDPKQSIYRFRRADIHTYLQARKELSAHGGRGVLDVNWRSTPELLAQLDRLLTGRAADGAAAGWSWFDREATGIDYTGVRAAPEMHRRSWVTTDTTGRGPITILRQSAAAAAVSRWRQARAMAGEIARLLAQGGRGLQFQTQGRNQPARGLRPDDIAVLTPRRRMIPVVLKALAAAGVPAASYKQAGLFEGDECLAVLAVLRAIDAPGDRRRLKLALLTCFFGYRPEQLVRWDGFPAGHQAPKWLAQWAQWAAERRWSRLSAALIGDTGVVARLLGTADGERRLSNLRQVLEYFCEQAYRKKLALPAAIRALAAAADHLTEGDADIQQIDSERAKVQVMTVHAGKGLEFPVVFLAEAPEADIASGEFRWQFHTSDGGLVYDLAQSAAHKPHHLAELRQEHARLMYVALTRARFKLYLPAMPPLKGGPPEWITRLEAAYPPTGSDAAMWVDALPPPPAQTDGLDAVSAGTPPAALSPLPQVPQGIIRRQVTIESFTHLRGSLAVHGGEAGSVRPGAAQGGGALVFGDRELFDEAIDDRLEAALLPSTREPGVLSPGGAHFGTLVHDVLEAVDFAQVGAAANPAALRIHPVAGPLIESHARRLFGGGASESELLVQAAIESTATLVWNALHTPLPVFGPAGPAIRLADLPATDCSRELEFQFALRAPEPALEAAAEGHLYGFIDLLFRCRPASGAPYRYFVLDWKTNRLENYDAAALEQCMQTEGYHLQHRLYALAMIDWLRGRLPQFDPARDFGGAVYLFLRGLNGLDAAQGVMLVPGDSPAVRSGLQRDLHAAIVGGDARAGARLLPVVDPRAHR